MVDHSNNPFSSNPDCHGSKGDDEFSFWGEEVELPRNETCPLLLQNHHYSNTSPRLRLQAIADARKELMDKIHDMPESTCELSLKDIVDEQLAPKHEAREENERFHCNTVKKKREKTGKSAQTLRSRSMEKETFMIKLFVPVSFRWERRGNGSKVSPGSSSDHVEKHRGFKRFLIPGDAKRNNPSNWTSFLGCWPVNKSKHNTYTECI